MKFKFTPCNHLTTEKFSFNEIKHRGQAMVLYALLIPVLLVAAGVGLDLGWYYLNVSRLQNAADAAVLAGAQELVANGRSFENYYVVSLVNNNLPADFDDYKDVFTNTFEASTSATGVLHNYKQDTDADLQTTLKAGQALVERYLRKNLSNSNEPNIDEENMYAVSTTDSYSISTNAADKMVNGSIELKYKIVDGKNDVYGPMYYVVNLNEKIRHFFMGGWFDDMDAPVRAVVLLKPHYRGLIEPMQQLERTMVIDNWEYAKEYRGTTGEYAGKWNHYQAGIKGNSNYGIRYTSGNDYREESVFISPIRKTSGLNVTTSEQGSSGEATDANGGKWYSATEVDSINIDMRAEVKGKFSTDWDIGYDFGETGHSYQFMEGWSATDGLDKRILFNVEFDEAFPTRNTSTTADPLWVRIESDPIKNPYNGAGVSNFNSVRQVTLNFNTDNSVVKTNSSGKKYYESRPYVIFYTGPENIDYATKDGVLIRHSQPVVLNLNANLNAIIYMPDSPVIINGNGNTWKGFIIAKCFLKSVTSEDMTGNDSFTLYDGFNAATTFTAGYLEGVDGYGNTVYVKSANLLTLDEIKRDNANYKPLTDATTGEVSFYEEFVVPEYPIISFSKDLYANCKTQADYFAKTAEYINTNYTKAKFATYAGIDESQVSMITFPDETFAGKYHNFTAVNIPVKTADLKDTDPDPDAAAKDDKYVKVMLGEEEKYIAKSKLPHIKIQRNTEKPYVCLYDLKTGLGSSADGGFSGVKPLDDSTDTILFENSANNYKDTWAINKDLLVKTYDVGYQSNKLQISEKDGFKYFMLKSDLAVTDDTLISQYRKVTVDEEVKYVQEGKKLYYTKVDNNKDSDGNVINYIIVDENGNILTKPVTSPDIFGKTTVAQNLALEAQAKTIGNPTLSDYWNEYTRDPKDPEEIPDDRGTTEDGKYVCSKNEYRKDEDYRIPAFERVYMRSTFNLSNDSGYSYFDIEELVRRSNYFYLNVDELNHTVNKKPSENWKVEDMFFVTERAAWID